MATSLGKDDVFLENTLIGLFGSWAVTWFWVLQLAVFQLADGSGSK